MDAFLLISTIIIAVVLLFVNIYVLAIYIHPDDKGFGTSILAKILVVLGLTLAWGQVFMVPLDVANARGDGGGLDMDVFWKIIMIADAVMLVILIPFGIFRYEGDEQASFMRRLWSSICYTIGTVIVFGLVIGISYAFLSKAKIPVTAYTVTATVGSDTTLDWTTLSSSASKGTEEKLKLDVSFPVYIMAFFSLVGWIFFLIFGGLGLFAIPMDLINDYRFKPKKREQRELAAMKQNLQTGVADLIEMGQSLKQSQEKAGDSDGFWGKRKAEGKVKRDKNKYKAAVLMFEKEFELYTLEKNIHTTNPLVYLLKLLAGLFLFCISIIWWIQILVYAVIRNNNVPLTGFLTNMLVDLQEGSAGFVATAILALLSIYLIWAVTKGNMKFGVRIPFLFTLHPMKPNETLMNSFLFNVWIILISSIAVIQFLTTVFEQYVRLSTVDMLFGTQVKYMEFYQWFYTNRIFEYALLIWSALGLFIVCCWGRRKSQELKRIEQLKREISKNKK